MKTINLIELLTGVKATGAGKWQAKCPAHADKQASLSIKSGDDGRTLLFCHAGCEVAEILAAIGLEMTDLFPERPYDAAAVARRKPKQATPKKNDGKKTENKPLGEIVKIYDYVNADGQVVYQTVRYLPKDFRPRRPDGNGGWISSLGDIERIPYNLPNCLAAIEAHKPIYVVGGEKDADSLSAIGLVATCNPSGEGKWLESMSEMLAGADLVIIPDNDAQGWHHAAQVSFYSTPYAHSIRVTELEGLPLKGDPTDWVEAGHTKAELIDLARATPNILPELLSKPSDEELSEAFDEPNDSEDAPYALLNLHKTDLGNAEALIKAHGQDMHYCRGLSKDQFLIWDQNRWMVDERGAVQRWACETVRSCYGYLGKIKSEHVEDLFKHLKRSEKQERLNAMINLSRHVDKSVPVVSTDLDADPWLFNVQNGTLDLKTGELRPHNRADLITKIAPVEYDPTAECGRWLQFLSEVFQNDIELITYIQRIAGYCLSGSVKEQFLFILMGKGANGKSVLVETLRKLIGDYGSDTAVTTFTERQSDMSSVGLASLYGARMVSAAEGSGDQVWDEALLKKLTGGDPITARHLYCPFFTYLPQFKLLVSSNESPRLKGQGYAIKRRVRIIPFKVRFYDPQEDIQPVRDLNLINKLMDELPGILNWALQGCLDWQKHGLGMPQAVKDDTDKLFSDQDPLSEWMAECCEMNTEACTVIKELWSDYKSWCSDNNRDASFRNSQSFSRNLVQRDGIDTHRTKKARFLVGIKLVEQEPEELTEEEYNSLFPEEG